MSKVILHIHILVIPANAEWTLIKNLCSVPTIPVDCERLAQDYLHVLVHLISCVTNFFYYWYEWIREHMQFIHCMHAYPSLLSRL